VDASLAFRPIVWVCGTVALRILAVHWLWHWEHRRSSPPGLAGLLLEIARRPAARIAARAAYLVGPFLLAAALRVAEPRDLGLVAPASGARFFVAILGSAAVCAVLVVQHRRWAREGYAIAVPLAAHRVDPAGFLTAGVGAFLLEAHWAFVRSGPLATGLANPALAVYCAVGLLALQSWSDPRLRAELVEPEAATGLAPAAILAILSAGTFLLTQSSLACLAIHLGVAVAFVRFGIPAAAADPGPDAVATVEPTVL
jgi:hypothetical protein